MITLEELNNTSFCCDCGGLFKSDSLSLKDDYFTLNRYCHRCLEKGKVGE